MTIEEKAKLFERDAAYQSCYNGYIKGYNDALKDLNKAMITKEDILNQVKEYQKSNPAFRYGQAVFNYIDQEYGVARTIQFKDHIDCFYDDSSIDKFIDKSLEYINNSTNE